MEWKIRTLNSDDAPAVAEPAERSADYLRLGRHCKTESHEVAVQREGGAAWTNGRSLPVVNPMLLPTEKKAGRKTRQHQNDRKCRPDGR